MNIIDENIINEYSIKNIDYISFADIFTMNDPLSTTSEYYLPFLMLLESWRAMTTPPNWEYSDFIKALEKRNMDLSNTEKETLKFVFGEIQTPPDNVERAIESFNKKSEKEQISMREEKLRALRKQTYEIIMVCIKCSYSITWCRLSTYRQKTQKRRRVINNYTKKLFA